jgi:hypothetical protein
MRLKGFLAPTIALVAVLAAPITYVVASKSSDNEPREADFNSGREYRAANGRTSSNKAYSIHSSKDDRGPGVCLELRDARGPTGSGCSTIPSGDLMAVNLATVEGDPIVYTLLRPEIGRIRVVSGPEQRSAAADPLPASDLNLAHVALGEPAAPEEQPPKSGGVPAPAVAGVEVIAYDKDGIERGRHVIPPPPSENSP